MEKRPEEQPELVRHAGVALDELAQMMAALPEWQSVREAISRAWGERPEYEYVVEVGRRKLREVGLGADAMFCCMPESYLLRMTSEEREQAGDAVEMYMVASVANEIATGQPLPVMPLAGGHVSVEMVEQGDTAFRVVHAFATPVGDPEDIAARFLITCYQTFDSATFDHRPCGARDAEWWRRHRLGESYRGIALSDDRSGLAPEARADPPTYVDEVRRATDVVRRAVRRFTRRWTEKLDSLSKGEG